MLFELLSGRRPFEADNIELLLNEVRTGALPQLRRIAPEIPIDLATICEKCLAKEPAGRFDSCEQLADEIDRWNRGEPIKSRPITSLERLVRWSKRNPAMASLWAGICLLSLLSMIVAIGMLLSKRQLSATESRLREGSVRLERSISEQERLTNQASHAAELARESAALAAQQELEAQQNLARLAREKETTARLSEQHQLLEGEHTQLQMAISSAERRLRDVNQDLTSKEQEVLALNEKMADAPWQEYVTWLSAADIAWMKKDPAQATSCLDRCPEDLRAWEWHFLRKHAAGESPEPVYEPLLADIETQFVTEYGIRDSPKSEPALSYRVSPDVAVNSDARRLGIWIDLLDANGRSSFRRRILGVADLDATPISAAFQLYQIPWLAKDTTWHQKTLLSDDGKFLAATGDGAKERRFLEVVDLTQPRRIVGEKWVGEGLPDLCFSANDDRFLAVSPRGTITVYSITDDFGAPPGTVLKQFSLPEVIAAQSCQVQSALFHNGRIFAVIVGARLDKLGLQNYPVLVIWEDWARGLDDDAVRIVALPPEFADVPTTSRDRNNIDHQFRIVSSGDQKLLAVVGKFTALVDLEKNAIVGEFPTPDLIGFSPDSRRLLGLEPEGQLEVWDVATGRKLPRLKIMRRAVEFLRTLQTRFSLEKSEDSWFRFDPSTATFHVLKRDEVREVTPLGKSSREQTRVTRKFYFVLGRLCLQAP
jgi:hypothetical protein